MFYANLKEHAVFSATGPQPQILTETKTFKSVLVGLEPGQILPPHAVPVGVYHFLDGNGWMIVGSERFAVEPGVTIIADEGQTRGIEAQTRLVFFASRSA